MSIQVAASVGSLLSGISVFEGLSASALAELEGRARLRLYRAGDTVFRRGDPGDRLYVIRSGRVKIQVGDEYGRESIICVLGPGDCFGEMAVLDGETRSADAIILEPVEAFSLPGQELLAFLQRHPQTALRVIQLLCRRLRLTNLQLEALLFYDIYTRLAQKLLELGQPARSNPKHLVVAMSQKDLAALIGATRESVNRALRYFRGRGYVEIRGRTLTILRPEALLPNRAPGPI